MTDRETIRQIIADEIARPEIQRELTDRLAQSLSQRMGSMLRHPFAITVAGFVLTFFVGSAIETGLAESRRAAAERETRISRAYAAERDAEEIVKEFVALVHQRAVEANLLRSAITRRSSPEILSRKAVYDEAYRAWNKREPEYRWALRQVWANGDRDRLNQRSPYERVTSVFIDRYFGNADACLTRNFDLYVNSIVQDRIFVNKPGQYCVHENWGSLVGKSTRGAKKCATSIQAIGLDVLRRQTDARVNAILADQPEELGHLVTETEVNALLDAACDIARSPAN